MSDIYDYQDAAGRYLFSVVVERTGSEKRVRQGVRHEAGTYSWGLNGRPRVLYCLPELIAHLNSGATGPVYVVEGEKDVETLRGRFQVATCNPMGAGKWTDEHTDTLAGARHVVVVADRDEPGRAHARAVYAALAPACDVVELVEPPEDLGEHADVTDLVRAGRTLDELVPLAPETAVEKDAQPAVLRTRGVIWERVRPIRCTPRDMRRPARPCSSSSSTPLSRIRGFRPFGAPGAIWPRAQAL